MKEGERDMAIHLSGHTVPSYLALECDRVLRHSMIICFRSMDFLDLDIIRNVVVFVCSHQLI